MRPTRLIPLAAFWALVLVPAACPVGLVAHGCAGDTQAACAHESVCDTDPCNVDVLPQDGPDDHAAAAVPAAVPPDAAPAAPVAAGVPATPAPPDRPDLPAPPAALPLLC